MGTEPAGLAALPQIELTVLPTRTIYKFASPQVQLTLTFLTPALPEDLDILSRPVTYLVWEVASADKKAHRVQIEFAASGELAVNTPDQEVNGSIDRYQDLVAAKIGSSEQPVLAKRGDDIRIDWGYLYVAVPGGSPATQVVISSGRDRLAGGRRNSACQGHLGHGQRRGRARVAVVDAGLRRSVFDPVHAAELAALLAPQRLASRRPAGGRRQRPARSPATLHVTSIRN